MRIIMVLTFNKVIKLLPLSVLITEMKTLALIIIFLESKPATSHLITFTYLMDWNTSKG